MFSITGLPMRSVTDLDLRQILTHHGFFYWDTNLYFGAVWSWSRKLDSALGLLYFMNGNEDWEWGANYKE